MDHFLDSVKYSVIRGLLYFAVKKINEKVCTKIYRCFKKKLDLDENYESKLIFLFLFKLKLKVNLFETEQEKAITKYI